MIRKAEVVIIGGGCVGTSIAYHLAKKGCPGIALLEKSHLAWGATGKSSAIVNVGVWQASKPLVRMLVESIRVFETFRDVVGGNSGFTKTGWLGLGSAEQASKIDEISALEKQNGADTKLLSISDLQTMEPQVFTDDLGVAVYEPSSGYADPVETTNSFARQAEKSGAVILTGVEVKKIRVENGRVKGVETNNGDVEAHKVVNAANVWAGKLFAGLEINLPITPSRKQVCLFKRPTEFQRPHRLIDDFVNDLYLKPEGEQTLVGEDETPGSVMNPDNYDEGVDYNTITRCAAKLVRRVPIMSSAVSRGGYAGPYDVSPDGHPILDEVSGVEGLYCAVGFSGHGFRFSPCTGRLMAEFILDGKTREVDIRDFRLNRFSEGKPIAPLAEWYRSSAFSSVSRNGGEKVD